METNKNGVARNPSCTGRVLQSQNSDAHSFQMFVYCNENVHIIMVKQEVPMCIGVELAESSFSASVMSVSALMN